MNALRVPAFRIYFAAFFVSNVGTWMQNFAQTWLLYKLTHSTLYLGYLGFAFSLPMTLVTPFGGGLADRFPRARVLATTQALSAVTALILAVLAATGRITPTHILAGQFTLALLLSVDNPTRQSIVPDLVPKEALPSALAFNSAIFTGAALLGPMAGGLLLARVGTHGLFAINTATFFFPLVSLLFLRKQIAAAAIRGSRTRAFAGLDYVRGEPGLRRLLLLGVVTAIFGRSYQQILPVFADDRFHRGHGGYSALLVSGGIGAILGALVLAALAGAKDRNRIVLVSVLVSASALASFAVTSDFHLALGAMLCTGAGAVVATTAAGTIIQTAVPPQLRGRVIALHVVTVVGLPFFGALFLSRLAHATSPSTAVLTFATVSALGVVAWYSRARTRNGE